MIKINLATRKQYSLTGESRGGLGGLGSLSLDSSALKEIPVRKLALLILVIGLGYYFLEDRKSEELQKVDALIAKLGAERTKLQSEVMKMKGYEEAKKALDQDEALIRTKIDVIQKLMTERNRPPRLLVALASSIPKDVWISEFKVQNADVSFRGASLGFNQISDFIKGLGESAYYTDVNLKNSQKMKDDTGNEVASFELSAKQR